VREVEANEDIVCRVLRSTKDELKVFDEMLKVGIPEKRKYCSSLQALVWYASDNEFAGQDPIVLMASYTVTFQTKGMYWFIESVWKQTYKTSKWNDFQVVVDRLNSPELVSMYMANNIHVVADAEGADYWQSAIETFERKGGDCEDHAMFAAHCLVKNGYEAYVVFVTSRTVREGHAVTLYVYPNTKGFFLFDNTRQMHGGSGISGPYNSIEEAVASVRTDWSQYVLLDINWNIITRVTR